MKKKYSSLRLIAWCIKLIAWISLIIAFLEIGFLIIVAEGVQYLLANQNLYYFVTSINTILGINGVVILVTALISFVMLSSVAERMRTHGPWGSQGGSPHFGTQNTELLSADVT